jgi:hypothetical protein
MAHKFDQTDKDPYVEAAHQLEDHVFSSQAGLAAGASDDIYTTLGNAIVTALGDIGAEAFRQGVDQPQQMKRLAQAVSKSAERVLMSYQGEVSAEPVIRAIEEDPRRETLTAVDADQLTREIEKTRELEHLLLSARRLPALIDLADSLGLRDHENAIDGAPLLVPGEIPTGPGASQLGARPTTSS